MGGEPASHKLRWESGKFRTDLKLVCDDEWKWLLLTLPAAILHELLFPYFTVIGPGPVSLNFV